MENTKPKSHYRGVSWDSSRKKWIVSIKKNGRTKYLGRFDSEIFAASVYNRHAQRIYGEDAILNFPEEANG